jgi:hypothetical protein
MNTIRLPELDKYERLKTTAAGAESAAHVAEKAARVSEAGSTAAAESMARGGAHDAMPKAAEVVSRANSEEAKAIGQRRGETTK